MPSLQEADLCSTAGITDEALTNEAHSFDIFPADTTDLVVYAKWTAMPAEAKDFDAGTFDEEIYEGAAPYSNTLQAIWTALFTAKITSV